MNIMNNLKATLESVSEKILDEYKKQYPSDLTASAKADVVELNGNYYIQLELAEHWKYVEFGRKPGKFPPVNSILKWMQKNSITPKQTKGNLPSTKACAFLIARKIAKYGIEGKYPLKKTMDNVNYVGNDLIEAALNDIVIKLKYSFDELF